MSASAPISLRVRILGGLSPLWAIPARRRLAPVVAAPVAGLAFRLRGHYFAIGTSIIAEVSACSPRRFRFSGRRLRHKSPASMVIGIPRPADARLHGILDRARARRGGTGADRAAVALALRPRSQGDPRQRARSDVQRHRRDAHEGACLYRRRGRRRHGRRLDLPTELRFRPTPRSASTTEPPS